MNAPRKKSAVKIYSPLHAEGKSADEVKADILADEKAYTQEEADEIYAAILEEAETPTNKVKTEIIEDGPLVKERSTRGKVINADVDEQVDLYNAQTKQTHKMPAEGAYRLVKQNPDKYQIVQ